MANNDEATQRDSTLEATAARHLESLENHISAGDARGAGADLGLLGRTSVSAGEEARGVLYFESALTLHRAIGDGWGAFLDLQSQGEAFLQCEHPGNVKAALACFFMAHEIGEALKVPETEQVEARYEVMIRQIADRFPKSADELRSSLQDDPDAIRMEEGVMPLLEDSVTALSFFEDQLMVARLIGDMAGELTSLGSQAQVLADSGQIRGAVAALVLAEQLGAKVPSEQAEPIQSMLAEWRLGVSESREAEITSLRSEVAADPESTRVEALSKVAGLR